MAVDGSVSKQMVKRAYEVNLESALLVHGGIAKLPSVSSQPVW